MSVSVWTGKSLYPHTTGVGAILETPCPSVRLSVCPSVRPSVRLSVRRARSGQIGTNFQTAFSPKPVEGFQPNLTQMLLGWTSFKINHMVPVRCLIRSQELKIAQKSKIFKNLLLQNHKAYSFNIWYLSSPNEPLPSLYKLWPPDQKWPRPGAYQFYIDLYRKTFKNLFVWHYKA